MTNKQRQLVPLIAISWLLTACASVHPGHMARISEGSTALPLEVSMENIDPDTNSPFQLVQVTYENTSDNWVRIARTEVKTGDPATSHLSVVVGKDLGAWAEGIAARETMDQHNKELLQSGLMVAGAAAAVAGSATRNEAVALSGLAVVAGTSIWAAADTINAKQRAANSTKLVPDAHLYAETIVPPKLFIRRWVLLNKKSGTMLSKLVFSLETVESVKVTYASDLVIPQ